MHVKKKGGVHGRGAVEWRREKEKKNSGLPLLVLEERVETGLEAEERVVRDDVEPLLERGAALLDKVGVEAARVGQQRDGRVAGERGQRAKLDGLRVRVQALLQQLAQRHKLAVAPVHKDQALLVLGERRLCACVCVSV